MNVQMHGKWIVPEHTCPSFFATREIDASHKRCQTDLIARKEPLDIEVQVQRTRGTFSIGIQRNVHSCAHVATGFTTLQRHRYPLQDCEKALVHSDFCKTLQLYGFSFKYCA